MDRYLQELEGYLQTLKSEHQALLALIERKREALRGSRIAEVRTCCELENQHVQKIGLVEKRRQVVVGVLTELLDPHAKQPLRLSEIVGHCDAGMRDRLTKLHQQLRELVEKVKKENSVVQRATGAMVQHIQGMVQIIGQTLGGGTYGRAGKIRTSPVMVSSFSTTG